MTLDQLKLLKQLAQLGDVTFINKTREGLVKAICEMDSAALALILDDEVSYQETTKATYLNRLNEIFKQFRETDTNLIAYEGKCTSTECSINNVAGVSFVGNNSGNYHNLIIEQNENGSIKDIYNCHKFCTEKKVENILKTEFNIWIYTDEKINFYASPRYNDIKNKCISAVNELKKEKDLNGEVLMSKQEIKDWIYKYQSVYDSFELPPLFYKEEDIFYWIFCDVENIDKYLNFEEEAAKAITEFHKLNQIEEKEILHWLLNYEHFYYDLILLHPHIISENDISNGRAKLCKKLDTYFNIEILKNCIELQNILDKEYNTMLNKYSTLTEEEKEKQSPFDDNYDEMCSLKYHLKKSGIV